MDDYNLKLKLKSELKTKMPRYIFKDFIEELNLNSEDGKYKLIDSIFEKYTVEEVKDLILKKYNEDESYSKYKENFLNTLNRLSLDEKSKLKSNSEKENKRNLYEKRKKIREENEKKRKEFEENLRKRKMEEENLRKKKIEEEDLRKKKIEEEKRKEQEENLRKKKIEEEERERELKEAEKKTSSEKTNLNEINKKNVFKKIFESSEKTHEKVEIKEDPKHEKHKTISKKFKYPQISKLKIYHAELTDVYFIYDYIKSEIRKNYKKNNTRLSSKTEKCVKIDQKLIDYKYDNLHTKLFTEELLEAIKLITAVYFADKDGVAILAVPPSKMENDPQTKKSIDLIEEWWKEGKQEIDFKVYNKSKFLIRTKDVESSKEGNRDVGKHEKSIECDKEDDMPLNIGAIILDDITTSGNTMYVCKNKLIGYGFDEGDIIPLAIARTLNSYNEIYDSSEGKYIVYDENVEELK